MDQPAATSADGVVEGPVAYRTNPTVTGERDGTLRLAAGRLSFVEGDGTVRFDAPVGEFHSLAEAEMHTAFDLWCGSQRHRLVARGTVPSVVVPPAVVGADPLGLAIGALVVATDRQALAGQRAALDAWLQLLGPLVAGEPPAGVKVGKPRGSVAYTLTVLAIIVVVVAVAFAAMFALSG